MVGLKKLMGSSVQMVDQLVTVTTEPLDGLEASVRNGSTRLTEIAADSALHAFPNTDLSLLNAGSIRIDDVLPMGNVSQYDVIRVLPFGGEFVSVSMPGDILKQALDVGLNNKGTGGFLHYVNVAKTADGWQVNAEALDESKTYAVSIAVFLIESGDAGLDFLVNNERILRLSETIVDSRFALIDELQLVYSQ